MKIASGKFHGEMQANGPRPLSVSVLRLARRARQLRRARRTGGAPRRVVAQEVDRLAHVAQRVLQRLAGLAHDHGHEPRAVALEEIGRGFEDLRACRAAQRVPGVLRFGARCRWRCRPAPASVMRTVPMRSRRSCGQVTRLAESPPAVVCAGDDRAGRRRSRPALADIAPSSSARTPARSAPGQML